MAIYHFHVGYISRGNGDSAIATAAYRAGEGLESEYYGKKNDYTRKGGVIFSEILLPSHAPPEYSDRETLWNALEKAEKRKDAQLAYSFDIALQNEFTMEENKAIVKEYLQDHFVSRGMIADFSIHKPEKGGNPNPHFHVMCPVRPLKEDGTWGTKQKAEYLYDENGDPILNSSGHHKFNAVHTTDWSDRETLEEWRSSWAEICNREFERKGLDCRIDHRSYKEQGIDQTPTVHEGVAVREMERRGIRTGKGDWNRLIRSLNAKIKKVSAEIKEIRRWIKAEESKASEPALAELLLADMARQDIHSFSYIRKKENLQKTSRYIAYLQEHGITTLADFEAHIEEINEEAKPLQTEVTAIRDRRRQINDLLNAGKRCEELKPVFTEYSKIHFKKAKEKFAAEHDKELKTYFACRRKIKEHLDDNGVFRDKPLLNECDTLTKRLEQIDRENKPLQDKIVMLREIRKAAERAQTQSPETEQPQNSSHVSSMREYLETQKEKTERENTQREQPPRKHHNWEI